MGYKSLTQEAIQFSWPQYIRARERERDAIATLVGGYRVRRDCGRCYRR